MLQDAIFARKAWLAQAGNEDIAVKFLRATFRGWIFCRDNAAKCVDHVLAAGTTLGKGHQAWQMNEVNAAHLAVAERHRHHRPGAVGPDDRRRDRGQGPHRRPGGGRLPERPGREGLGRPHGRHQGRELREGHRQVTEGGE